MNEAVKITIDDLTAAAAELRRLHAELERKSDAIQRLWKERDELRALNAELVEALRQVEGIINLSPHALSITRTALMKAKLEYENEDR